MDFWQRYRAIDARDPRFDGQFVTAVSSTGIYCRPSCPARTPKPDNVSFYRTSAAAHEAGYRACKRCLPEAVPGDPEWNLRGDVAARAMRLIADGEVDRSGVSGLAARLRYSARHLNRILRDEVGAGALALARAQRAQTARALLTCSSLTFAEVAFAAGFGSIRQFNETVHQVFDLTPGQMRKAAYLEDDRPDTAAVDRVGGRMVRLSLSLPLRLPYDHGIFSFLAERALSEVELCTDTSYERLVVLPGGPAWFRASVAETRSDGRGALPVTVLVSGLADLPALLARIRRLFDLDADPSAIDTALARDPSFGESAAAVPGIRLPGSIDPHETLLRAMAGEGFMATAGTEFLERLTSAGPTLKMAGTTLTRVFPSAHQIAGVSDPLLPDPSVGSVLRTVAARLADGSLDVGVGSDPATLRTALLAVDGVMPWTIDYVAIRVLGQPDVQLPACGGTHDGRPSRIGSPSPVASASLDARMEAVRPWRSYASMQLRRTGALAAEHTSARPGAA